MRVFEIVLSVKRVAVQTMMKTSSNEEEFALASMYRLSTCRSNSWLLYSINLWWTSVYAAGVDSFELPRWIRHLRLTEKE